MAVVGATAGTKFYIGTTEAAPSPDDWVEIQEINNLGGVMQQFSKIAVESVGSGYTRQIKGTESVPTMSLNVNRKDDDPGQVALKAAYSDRNSLFNFRIVENDIGAGFSATTTVFKGRVYSKGTQYGGVNDLKKVAVDVEIEPDSIVIFPAT